MKEMENNLFKDMSLKYSNPTKVLYIITDSYKKDEKVKLNKFIVYLKRILKILMLCLLIILSSCSTDDSIDNYKGGIIVYKQTYRCLEDDLYYNQFRIKIKDKKGKYSIITVKCLDGNNYRVGDKVM